MNYSDYQFKYDLFLASTSQNQSDIIRYTSECACLESGDLRGISVLNESVVDSIKNTIKKIIAAISTIWKKFVERANELLTTDASYLEKYKSIILSKPPKSKEITMYQYNHEALKLAVPPFTYDEKMKKWLASSDAENTFTATFLPTTKLNENADLKEAILELVRGSEQVDLDGKNLDMKKMYEYCANYKATIELIKKDTDTIAKSQAEVDKLLGQLAPKIKAADDTKKDATATQNTSGNSGGTSEPAKPGQSIDAGSAFDKVDATSTGESSVYSSVYGVYVTEADKVKIGGTKEDPKTATPTAATTKGAQVDNGVGKGIVTKDTTTAMGGDLERKSQEEFDTISKNSPVFFRSCGHILAAKLTICQEIQKNYMAIIRAHVRDYVGETK